MHAIPAQPGLGPRLIAIKQLAARESAAIQSVSTEVVQLNRRSQSWKCFASAQLRLRLSLRIWDAGRRRILVGGLPWPGIVEVHAIHLA